MLLCAVTRFDSFAAASGDEFFLMVSDEHSINGKISIILNTTWLIFFFQ